MNHQRRWTKSWRRIGFALHQPDQLRLATDIESLQTWVDRHKRLHLTKDLEPQSPNDQGLLGEGNAVDLSEPWHSVCEKCLARARDMVASADIPSGYEFLHIAEREAVYGMTKEERLIRAKSLREEVASKLNDSWRARTVGKLLGSDFTLDVPAEALAEALLHRNTNDRNMHRKMDKVRWQLAWLGLFIGVLVLAAFAVALLEPELPTGNLGLLPYGIYLGLLGGLMSAAMSAKGTDRKASVPEIGVEFYARIARSLLGAAASVPVYIAGVEGIVTIGSSESSKSWGLLLLCFISGFSERWFRGTVAAFAGDVKKKQEKSDMDQK